MLGLASATHPRRSLGHSHILFINRNRGSRRSEMRFSCIEVRAIRALLLASVIVTTGPSSLWGQPGVAPPPWPRGEGASRFVELGHPSRSSALPAALPPDLAAETGLCGSVGLDAFRADALGSADIDGVWLGVPPPSPRAGHTMTFDPVRNRLLVFGGSDIGHPYRNDLWEISLSNPPAWHHLHLTSNLPRPRFGHSAIYDPRRDRIIVFGGYVAGVGYSNEVWSLSLSGGLEWSQMQPIGTPPDPRSGHTAAYDPIHSRMLVFGGTGTSLHSDVWELSLLGRPCWKQVIAQGVSPAKRYGHSAIYDPIGRRMVIFGGGRISALNDLWQLSLVGRPAWEEIVTDGMRPGPRIGHTATYDPVGDRMLVIGGGSPYPGLDTTWVLSLRGAMAWSRLETSPRVSLARRGHAAAYVPKRGAVVIFAGYGDQSLGDVWELRLLGSPMWQQLFDPGAQPAGHDLQSAILDSRRKRMVLFGESPAFSPDLARWTADVWMLSLEGAPAWKRMDVIGTSRPPLLHEQSAVYDSLRDRMIVFGGKVGASGYYNEVWCLALGGNPTWSQLATLGSPPSARAGQTAIYDPVRDRMVVFGGTDGYGSRFTHNDTWALSLSGAPIWTPMVTTGTLPTPRSQHAAVYDRARDRMIIFGGQHAELLNDIWVLSFAGNPAWTEMAPSGTPPSGRAWSSAIWDPLRDRMVIFGGYAGSSTQRSDVWTLSCGASEKWTLLSPLGAPPSWRSGHVGIYDPFGDRMVISGGLINDTWMLDWGGAARMVAIDIEPGNANNLIPLRSQGAISVAILGAPNLEVSFIDPGSIKLAGAPAGGGEHGGPPELFGDVNDDGLVDLILDVPTGAMQLAAEDTFALLEGWTFDGVRIRGSDRVRVVPDIATGPSSNTRTVERFTTTNTPELALQIAGANPATIPLVVSVAVPPGPAVRLDLLDVSGRIVLSRDLQSLGPGAHRIELGNVRSLPAGMYFARLAQANRVRIARVCLLR